MTTAILKTPVVTKTHDGGKALSYTEEKEWKKLEAKHAILMKRMNRVCNRKADTQEDGMRFGIEVLKILEDAGGDDLTSAIKGYIDTTSKRFYLYRRGPQSRLLWRALDEFAIMHKPAQVGFAIVLTDYLGSVFNGAVPDVAACYERGVKLETWQLNEHGRPA
jgi:hypothetical protein